MRKFFTLIFILTAALSHAQDSLAFICFYPGENVPQFPGGDVAFVKYLEDSTRYPSEARASGKQGTVYVYFTIDADGSVNNAYVKKGLPGAKELDDEALRVVSAMPDWIPGKTEEKNAKVLMVVPIQFVLDTSITAKINTAESDTTIYDKVDSMPQYPGGDAAMMNFISTNVRYPRSEKEKGIMGTVYISYVVEKDGTVTNVTIAREVENGPGLAKESARVVKLFPKHSPGVQDGKPVRVRMTIPVKFVLH